jgi:hypothetical protein
MITKSQRYSKGTLHASVDLVPENQAVFDNLVESLSQQLFGAEKHDYGTHYLVNLPIGFENYVCNCMVYVPSPMFKQMVIGETSFNINKENVDQIYTLIANYVMKKFDKR